MSRVFSVFIELNLQEDERQRYEEEFARQRMMFNLFYNSEAALKDINTFRNMLLDANPTPTKKTLYQVIYEWTFMSPYFMDYKMDSDLREAFSKVIVDG